MSTAPKKRILVLEDLAEMRNFIVSALSSQGYDVLVPVDSYVALSLARQQPFDLVTVDLYMPLMDGLAFLQALRDLDIHIPTVVVTAYKTDPKIDEIRKMGVRHILAKPFQLEELYDAIRDLLGEQDLKEPIRSTPPTQA